MQFVEAMSRILVATDFSPCSNTAVHLAAALARRGRVPLVLFHVIESLPSDLIALPADLGRSQDERDALAKAQIERQAAEVRSAGLDVETWVMHGPPASLILGASDEMGVELIVVGTHGRTGAAHLFLGSVAERVAHSSTRPVLVTREGVPATARWQGMEPLRLTTGFDGSPASEAALSWIGGFTRPETRELTVVRVYSRREEALRYGLDEPSENDPREADLRLLVERDLERSVRQNLGEAAAELHVRAGRDAAETLTSDPLLQRTDALVVGRSTHRARGGKLSMDAILRSSLVPVFCIPEPPAIVHADENARRAVD